MRISALLLLLVLGLPVTARSQVQDPGAQQDAEAAREKLLKASDELDNIQANSEATKESVDGMKSDVAKLQGDVLKLQSDNALLKQQLADMQAALDKSEAARLKDRQTLIDNVADMIAAGHASEVAHPAKKKKDSSGDDSGASDRAHADAGDHASSLAPPPDKDSTSSPATHTANDAETTPDTPPPVKRQKGYYHVVESGETITLICKAYREQGVKVTASEIRRANGLTENSTLKVGQKLFIPQPDN